MILDTSAITAIVMREPGYEVLLERMGNSNLAVGTATLTETAIVLSARLKIDARPLLSRFLSEASITIVPFGESHYAAAVVRHWEWDWEGAEAAFRKAIEINPNYARARAWYAYHLSAIERPDEARVQMDRALALDPYRPGVRTFNAGLLCDVRQYAECIEEYKAALRIEPDYPMAQMNLAWAYQGNGNYDEALEQVRQWWFPGDQELDEALDRGYAEGGFRSAMLRYAETLAARPELAERLPIALAITFAWAGDKDRTLDWFEVAYQAHAPNLVGNLMLTVRPELHDEPRFHDLRRRVGLPQTPQ